MTIARKATIALACVICALIAHAEENFPTRPVKLVVGTPAGGGTDIIARMVGTQLQKQLGQAVVVDNRPGASTMIAAQYVSKSPADGYTILAADPGTIMYNTALYKSLPYDPVQDFAPVGLLARVPLLLVVGPNSKFDDVGKLIAAMRAEPDKFPVATAGVGAPHHIALEFLKSQANLRVPHVPYKGAAPAMQDVLGGVVPVMVADYASGMGNIKAGKLKVLATFSAERLPSLPDVPSLVQLGLTNQVPPSYLSVVAPIKTPPAILEKLSVELQKALSDPAVQTSIREMGSEPLSSTSAQMKQQWSHDMTIWPALIRDRAIHLD